MVGREVEQAAAARVSRTARPTIALSVATFAAAVLTAPAAVGVHADRVIVLPGASSTEGIARGAGTTFYFDLPAWQAAEAPAQ